jgi:hypothetical protein
MIDHADDHLPRTKVKTKLHGDEHNGKENADKRHGEARPIVKQVSYGKGKYHRLGRLAPGARTSKETWGQKLKI